MRVHVAVLATGKSHAFVVRRAFPRLGAMALQAGYIFVKSRERVGSSGMIKPIGRLPRVLVVATEALGAELARVGILVAAETLLAQPQVGLIQVLDFDFAAGRRRDMRGVVTLFARQLGVLALQGESRGPAMLEFLAVKLGERKLPPIVLHVAVGAIGLIGGRVVDARVVAGVFVHTPADFGMAIETLETARGEAEIMTGRTLGGAFE